MSPAKIGGPTVPMALKSLRYVLTSHTGQFYGQQPLFETNPCCAVPLISSTTDFDLFRQKKKWVHWA